MSPREPHFWLSTVAGGEIDILEPEPPMFDLTEMAEAIAKLCRFGGRIRGFWSVAEHSVLMARHATPEAAPYCLMHDVKETVVADVPTPTKRANLWALAGLDLPAADEREWRMRQALHGLLKERQAAFEDRIDASIHRAAGLAWPLPAAIAKEVKCLDLRALATERKFLMAPSTRKWAPEVEAARPFYRVAIRQPLPWELAAAEWLREAQACLPAFAHRRAAAFA